MRGIEHEIVQRTRDDPKSWIKLSNFYGIEIKGFAAEIARLALLIAEFQSDVRFISQHEARAMVLPLHNTGHIVIDNALRLDWLEVCPPVSKALVEEHDLAGPTGRMALEDNGLDEGGEPETFICGNPPYFGSRRQNDDHKDDLEVLLAKTFPKWRSLDYVSGWFFKSHEYAEATKSKFAFVATSSLSEGLQISAFWSKILTKNTEIFFAYRPFKWSNLASKNAGVSVVIVGLCRSGLAPKKRVFDDTQVSTVGNINPYLVGAPNVFIDTSPNAIAGLPRMVMGSMPRDGGNLILDLSQRTDLLYSHPEAKQFVRRYAGSEELINGQPRYCLWISEKEAELAGDIPPLRDRFSRVSAMRAESTLDSTKEFADRPYRFVYLAGYSASLTVAIGGVSSESRPYLPVDIFAPGEIVSNLAFAIYNAPLWTMALLSSSLHISWTRAVCGKRGTSLRYSNTLGWNTFPVPPLTEQHKAELNACAEAILLAREAHFPATIADLYDPEAMPDDLRRAHEANDETLERIYIGRRFKNDTERLEKLFEMYTKMTAGGKQPKKGLAA
jgi:hypothetical protein